MKATIPILITLISLTSVSYSQTPEKINTDVLVEIRFKCFNDTLTIKIPNGQYKTQWSWYTEGSIFRIVYADRSAISILCGGNAELVLNEKKKDLFARKTEVYGQTIIYEFVRADRLDIFNKAFDLMGQK